MKKKYLAAILGVMIATTSVTACGVATTETTTNTAESSENKETEDTTVESAESTDDSDSSADVDKEDSDEEDVTYGEVKSVEDGKIIIAVGTMKEMGGNGGAPGGDASSDTADKSDAEAASDDSSDEAQEKPDGDNADGNGGTPGGDQGEAPSMLDLTGDEMTVTVTDDTVITKESAGGPGGAPGGNQGEAPEKPDGDSTDGNGQGEAPEKPDGDNGNGQAPGGDQGGAPDGNNSQSETIELSDIQEGDIVAITTDDDGNALTIKVQSSDMGGGQGGPGGAPGGQSQGVDSYDAANTYDSDTEVSDTSLESTGTDENAALVSSGANVTFDNVDITRNSSDSTGGDNSSFYGVGAALLATEGNAYVKGGTVTTDAAGGTYTSNGVGSPAVYCTADIAVKDATLTANGSEAVCIEGLNSLHLFNCDLTGNMSDLSQNDSTWTVILYQSMSGDSEVGNSTFQMDGGTITSKNGGLFYTTNTECTITLKDVDITYNDDNEFFLQCTGNNNQRGWGQSGANGSDCNFTADSQDMKGNVIWDSISDLDFYMTNGSTLEGAFVNDESNAGNGGDGYCNVVIDKDSTWTVTGDSIITSLSNAGTITDADGKTVSIVGTDGTTYVEGDSDYTITVGSYQDSADTSASTTVDDWSNYEIERPESL